MPNYELEPVSLSAPTTGKPFLGVTFRLPPSTRNSIHPATGLQLSIENKELDLEAFMERVTDRDVTINEADATLRSFQISESTIPPAWPPAWRTQLHGRSDCQAPRMAGREMARKLGGWHALRDCLSRFTGD